MLFRKLSFYILYCYLGFFFLDTQIFTEQGQAALQVIVDTNIVRVQFGEALNITFPLKNIGKRELNFLLSDLFLYRSEWSSSGKGGSNWGMGISLNSEEIKNNLISLSGGESINLYGIDEGITFNVLGKMEIKYRLRSKNSDVQTLLTKANKAIVNISVEILPSDFMLKVWSAENSNDLEEVRKQFRTMLLSDSSPQKWQISDFIRHNLDYLADRALPLIAEAIKDSDPLIRAKAISAYHYSAWAVGNLNDLLNREYRYEQRPDWLKFVRSTEQKLAIDNCVKAALLGLKDKEPLVRRSAIAVLDERKVRSAIKDVKELIADADASVRLAALRYLSLFAAEPGVTESILKALSDSEPEIRDKSLWVLETSPEKPSLNSLKQAFLTSKGDSALRLLRLLIEQEDSSLSSVLLPNFESRSTEEKLAIMSVIAGHIDSESLEIVKLGLIDGSCDVQRAALMRLLGFQSNIGLKLLDNNFSKESSSLHQVAENVRTELRQRKLFPFLSYFFNNQVSAFETVFPSVNGMSPKVSPDGQWVAYVETGWGRPGGAGGTGGSNVISLVHSVRVDGTDDRIISDMYLVSWLSDSRHIASSRDGFAAICDLDGKIVIEFGEPLNINGKTAPALGSDWRKGELREQFGVLMPHSKRLTGMWQNDFGHKAAFSGDGKLFGPLRGESGIAFIDSNEQRINIKIPFSLPEEQTGYPRPLHLDQTQAAWSPDGKYVIIMPTSQGDAIIVSIQTKQLNFIKSFDGIPSFSHWNNFKYSWYPWSSDSSRITFIKKGQVWFSNPDGSGTGQLTFDSTTKAFPTFSRNGKYIAYITWIPNRRWPQESFGKTDIWVVEVETKLAVRLTAPSQQTITSLEWIDDSRIIFDRSIGSLKSSLMIIDLKKSYKSNEIFKQR